MRESTSSSRVFLFGRPITFHVWHDLIMFKSGICLPLSVFPLNLLKNLENLQKLHKEIHWKGCKWQHTVMEKRSQSVISHRKSRGITFDFGIRPTLKKPICPVSILVQSTTVDAMFSGEAPSHSTPST